MDPAPAWPRLPAAWALRALRAGTPSRRPREVFGLRFPNPVGLAAGMDKDGRALPAWPALGFGFVEVGTVTWHAQPGNDRPRLFRLPAVQAVINRMGFNNAGATALAARLAALRPAAGAAGHQPGQVQGDAAGRGRRGLPRPRCGCCYPHGDYFAVNVSSPEHARAARAAGPRAPGRAAGGAAGRGSALAEGHGEADAGQDRAGPDRRRRSREALEVCLARGVAGVIATNTTLARTGLAPADVLTGGAGGRAERRAAAPGRARWSASSTGRPAARCRSSAWAGSSTPTTRSGWWTPGASLVQLYTGLIYRGPELVRRHALGPLRPRRIGAAHRDRPEMAPYQ